MVDEKTDQSKKNNFFLASWLIETRCRHHQVIVVSTLFQDEGAVRQSRHSTVIGNMSLQHVFNLAFLFASLSIGFCHTGDVR